MDKRLDWILKYNKENNNEYGDFVFSGKYLAVYRPNHHRARKDGYVYIHQLQAEKMLGRKLNKKECVHHKDYDKFNNDINNLMVFKTIADHTAFHNGSEIYIDGDVWVAKIQKSYICPICKINTKTDYANMCVECYHKNKSSHLPSKEILMELILNYPMTTIGKMYNVSDNSIRKWCKKYNLPYLKKDIDKLKIELHN